MKSAAGENYFPGRNGEQIAIADLHLGITAAGDAPVRMQGDGFFQMRITARRVGLETFRSEIVYGKDAAHDGYHGSERRLESDQRRIDSIEITLQLKGGETVADSCDVEPVVSVVADGVAAAGRAALDGPFIHVQNRGVVRIAVTDL